MRFDNRKTGIKRLNGLNSSVAWLALGLITMLLFPLSLMARNATQKNGPPPVQVKVSSVVEKEVTPLITLVGTGEPWLETVIASEEEGLVRKMHVDEGDKVQVGQILCEQDTTQLVLKIQSAKAALAEAKVLQDQTRRERERQKRLFAIESVAEKAYEDAQFNADVSRKRVLRLSAELRALRDRLKKRKIKAPVSGYVVKRHALIGQWLGEGDPVVTLLVPDPIRVIVPVPERYISSVNTGAKALVNFDALPHQTFEGLIAAIIPKAEPATRTFPVRIEIPNPNNQVKAGMFGRITLPVGKPHKALVIPKDALIRSDQGTSVYIVNEGKAQFLPVRTGQVHGPHIEVLEGLRPGQQLVVYGKEQLKPEDPLQVIELTEP